METPQVKWLLILPPLLFVGIGIYLVIPPRVPLSPEGHQELPTIVKQSLKASDTASLGYYLAGSEKYLSQARKISQETQTYQTEGHKQEIITFLNLSLQQANNAVSHYPTQAESYLQRARVLEVISVVDQSAKDQAAQDRATYEQLAQSTGSQPTSPIKPTDLIQVEPIQEASLLSQAIIALPQEELQTTAQETQVSAHKGHAIIPQGQTQVKVNSTAVKDDKLIYFKPNLDTQGAIIALGSKSQAGGTFTLTLSNPLPYDLPLDWWIID